MLNDTRWACTNQGLCMPNGRAQMGTLIRLSMLNCLLGWVALTAEEEDNAVLTHGRECLATGARWTA